MARSEGGNRGVRRGKSDTSFPLKRPFGVRFVRPPYARAHLDRSHARARRRVPADWHVGAFPQIEFSVGWFSGLYEPRLRTARTSSADYTNLVTIRVRRSRSDRLHRASSRPRTGELAGTEPGPAVIHTTFPVKGGSRFGDRRARGPFRVSALRGERSHTVFPVKGERGCSKHARVGDTGFPVKDRGTRFR